MSRRGDVKARNEALYEPVASVPEGLRWKPGHGPKSARVTTLFSLGNIYKLQRDRDTGALWYYKLRDTGPEKSPAESIDAEPTAKKQIRYNVGKHCWLIIDGRWFCCEVVGRTQEPATITLRPTTGWDAERQTPWPHSETLEFTAQPTNPLFQRLRPLKARQT